MHRFLITFRFFASLLPMLCLVWLSPETQAQTTARRPIAEWLESHRPGCSFEPVQGLLSAQAEQNRSDKPAIQNASLLSLDRGILATLLEADYSALRLLVPNAYGSDFDLELVQVDILGEGFTVGALGQHASLNADYQRGAHYRGIIRGNPNSIVAVSLTTDGLMGMITDDSGTYTLGKMEDGSEDYLLYRREDLPTSPPHACFTDEVEQPADLEPTVGERGVGCRTVQIYFECDYKLYSDKGSTTSGVTNYVTSLFNQTAALYANENVSVAISEIYVWTSPDPYQNMGSTSSVLNAFRSNRGTNFNGNLAHFLSTRNLGGGVAYVDVICSKSYAYGVSGIYTSFQNVPTYSWSVEVLTHELGHNLGSWHTQSCNWPGGAIDNCVPTEGGCAPGPAPSNGGTIMSYCHLSSYGINFNNGFGPLPGDRIRSRVTAATCAPQLGTPPSNLSTSNVTATSAILNWGAVTGATSYVVQYKLASASSWTPGGTSTATSFTVNGLAANTAYNWQVKTDCSNFSPSANFTTTTSGGGGGGTCNAPTGLGSVNVTASSATLNWAAVGGATTYTVQYKPTSASAWTTAGPASGTNLTINNLIANTAYWWQVKANCSDWSAAANFTTASGGGGTCAVPAGLTASNVGGTSATLSWSPSGGATSYTVQYKTAAATTWTTAGSTANAAFTLSNLTAGTAYSWQVKANCSGWSATANFTTVGGGGTCATPTGLGTNNITTTSVTLTWAPAAGATSYIVQYRAVSSSAWIITPITTGLTRTLNNLSPNTSYQWQVKSNCSGNSTVSNFTTLNTGMGTCPAPADLSTTNVTVNAATLKWSAVPGATSYTVQFKNNSSQFWSTAGTTTFISYAVSGLAANTAYDWRVKANCSTYSATNTFTTLSGGGGGGAVCDAPINLTNNAIGSTWAVISWAAVSGATSYTLQIKLIHETTYTTLGTVGGRQVSLSGMQPNTAYNWRVKANCSFYSTSMLLTTSANLSDPGTSNLPQIVELSLFPNPAVDFVQLRFNGPVLPDAEIWVTDATGRLMLREAMLLDQQQLDVSALPSGVYFLVLRQGGQQMAAQRVVKL